MKNYELTVLIHPDLEADLQTSLKKVRDLITSNDGKITKEDIWGKKRLQYKINKEDFAVYVYFEVDLPASAPLKISNNLNIDDQILRYLLVKTDEKGKRALAEAEEAAAKRAQDSSDKSEEA